MTVTDDLNAYCLGQPSLTTSVLVTVSVQWSCI